MSRHNVPDCCKSASSQPFCEINKNKQENHSTQWRNPPEKWCKISPTLYAIYCHMPAGMGSQTNHPGFGQRQQKTPIDKLDNNLDKKKLKGTNRTFDSPFFLLRRWAWHVTIYMKTLSLKYSVLKIRQHSFCNIINPL